MKITEQELKEGIESGLTTKQLAEKFSMSERSIQTRKKLLAKKGYSPEHDMKHIVPDGFLLKGQSTYYNKEGKPTQRWVKSAIDRDQQLDIIHEFIKGASDELVRERPVEAPISYLSQLANLYVLTDFHLGMLAWGEESGDDYDMDIAEKLALAWMTQAVEQSPAAEVGILSQLGDFLHWDGLDAVTPSSGHVLDADTRFQKLTRVAIRLIRRLIGMMLTKHKLVHIICAEGNHDMASSIWMRELLTVLYEDEPRVVIDNSADPYYCYVHGKVSLFFHHGHKKRPISIDAVFASKFRNQFGSTEFSYAHMGHLHHQMSLESNLMIVEQHRTLAAKDAYASRGGWLSGRSAPVITYHKQYGEVSRLTISPEMLKDA